MTAAEFTAIVAQLYERAKRWLNDTLESAIVTFAEPPPLHVFAVVYFGGEFRFCTPNLWGPSKAPVCWINWETRRSDDELRNVLGQALSVLMRELGMEVP